MKGFKKDATGKASKKLTAAQGRRPELPAAARRVAEAVSRRRDGAARQRDDLCRREGRPLHRHLRRKFHILPLEKMNQIKQPPRTLPRPKNVMADFLEASRAGKKETAAPFEYGARLTEFTPARQPGPTRRRRQQGGVGRPRYEGHQPSRAQRVGEAPVPPRAGRLDSLDRHRFARSVHSDIDHFRVGDAHDRLRRHRAAGHPPSRAP